MAHNENINNNNNNGNSTCSNSPIDRVVKFETAKSKSWEAVSTMLTIPTAFHWTERGAKEVYLAGSFSKWQERHKMELDTLGKVFSLCIDLPAGIHSYKFVVDGNWRWAADQPCITDEHGNVNNCIHVTGFVPKTKASVPTHFSPTVFKRKHKRTKSGSTTKVLHNQLLLPGTHQLQPKELRMSYDADINNRLKDTTKDLLGDMRLLIFMVGLPARGKSFVSRKLCRYLNWMGFKSKVLNFGSYRRTFLGSFHSHDFFRPDNPEGTKARDKMAQMALADMIKWFKEENGVVGILDGTNSTKRRRKILLEEVKKYKQQCQLREMFIEIICTDSEVIEANVLSKVHSPDYTGVDKQKVVRDFLERIRHYEEAYETLSNDLRYIKIYDVGKQIVTNRINGYLPSRIVFFLSNLHIKPRSLFLTRHGQSEYCTSTRLGGDSSLTAQGLEYAKALASFLQTQGECKEELCVWSSTMARTVQTAQFIPSVQYVQWKAMDELNVGIFDGLTLQEVRTKFPKEIESRNKNKLHYRYPRGESYEDLILRLEPIIIELERQRKPILIIGHRAVLKCLYAYFSDLPMHSIPDIQFPLEHVVKLKANAYNTPEERFKFNPTTSTLDKIELVDDRSKSCYPAAK